MPAKILAAVLSAALLGAAVTGAEACCGPNSSPSFFRHQYHAFRRGHVPGYLHERHRSRALPATR